MRRPYLRYKWVRKGKVRILKGGHWKIRVAWIVAFFWCLLCVFLSSQKLSDTTQLSTVLTHFILKVFHLPGQSYYTPVFDGFRLAAHVIIFSVLSILICITFLMSFGSRRNAYRCTFGIGIFFSIMSELGKNFIPGRHCSISDMILNLLGCILGVGLVHIFRKQR